jgi:LL-diaminopimelate aminotransferase
MKVMINKADRLWKMPSPVLGNMKFTRMRLAARHVDLIDLDNFIPELPQLDFEHIPKPEKPFGIRASADDVSALKAKILEKHLSLKSAQLDPDRELIITPGIRMSAACIALGILNPGDNAAYPDPGLGYIRSVISIADGVPKKYSLSESNDFVLNIANLATVPFRKIKILFLNYPHNPTGAAVDYYFYRELPKALRFRNILVVSDNAYVHPGDSDISGPLSVSGAKQMAVELHSFATTLGIPGLGFAAGHKDVISIIKSFLAAVDYKPDYSSVKLADYLLDNAENIFTDRMAALEKRRELLSDGLKKLGWHVHAGRLLPFIWAKPPVRGTSVSFSRRLFIKAGIKVSPGTDYGEAGEGWLRMSLSQNENTIGEALERLAQHSKIWQRKFRPET